MYIYICNLSVDISISISISIHKLHNLHVYCDSFDDRLVCRGIQGTATAKAIATWQVVQGAFDILNILSILVVVSSTYMDVQQLLVATIHP